MTDEKDKEISRLSQVISDLHKDLALYDGEIKRQQMIIQCQNDIICAYSELVGLIGAKVVIE